jgi:hypothetical protein
MARPRPSRGRLPEDARRRVSMSDEAFTGFGAAPAPDNQRRSWRMLMPAYTDALAYISVVDGDVVTLPSRSRPRMR